MLPKLSERAATRCTSNITRFYPEWKQAQIRASGDGLEDMEAFIDLNKDHLSKLRELIAEGERVCIDAGWPQPGSEAEPEVTTEPEIIEVDRPETLERMTNLEAAIQDEREKREAAEAKLSEAAQAKVDERKPEPVQEEPPAEIAGLFDPNLTPRQNQEALQKKYAALMSERELELSAGNSSKAMELLKRAEVYDSGITWNRARLVEVI